MPDIMESVFSVCYLAFGLIAGVVYLCNTSGRTLVLLYGVATLVLCFGDMFHLVPRVARAVKGPTPGIINWMNTGLQVTSISMTIFYILLLYIWKYTFPEMTPPQMMVWLIWLTAIARIVICLMPQNNWRTGGNAKMSELRNCLFLFTGVCMMMLYWMSGNAHDYHMTKMVWAIGISFACYLPVAAFAKKKPAVGMLMMPKTLAYVWMIVMGFQFI